MNYSVGGCRRARRGRPCICSAFGKEHGFVGARSLPGPRSDVPKGIPAPVLGPRRHGRTFGCADKRRGESTGGGRGAEPEPVSDDRRHQRAARHRHLVTGRRHHIRIPGRHVPVDQRRDQHQWAHPDQYRLPRPDRRGMRRLLRCRALSSHPPRGIRRRCSRTTRGRATLRPPTGGSVRSLHPGQR